MPVRGRGHYKRPYRLSYTDRQGRKVNKAFHWPGPWEEEKAWLRDHRIDFVARVKPEVASAPTRTG